MRETYLLVDGESDSVGLLDVDDRVKHSLLGTDIGVLLVSRHDLEFGCRGRPSSPQRHLDPESPHSISRTLERGEWEDTHMSLLSRATNLGETGSMTFLFKFQIASHSRLTTAWDGPCKSMYCLIASIDIPRRRIPAASLMSTGRMREMDVTHLEQ
jgi:hypothetical protein